MLTSKDVIERRRAVANAVANQRLEGLEPDSRTVADLERAAAGELSVSDVLRTLHARVAAGEFRSSSAR
ncbi:antitoxin VbhA family protein [Achromobacter sp. MY14]|jgi:cytochrome P450|uniref:antitoxin VbhA family protein n=1 Tax=unclassified Achromobacter TaxID=2626865 RepID=UPI001E325658|nr:antitoxin VbhA family protein [Achromobacter sp. MY14]MCD0501177.1 antitoxin VbhA family protein [Achromobacter sp. MY14]